MQYIQLQGQVAAELDLPINGAYNLFIDTSDNSIKAKDSDGNLTGGGTSLVEIAYDDIQSAIESGSLVAGAFYKITGAATGSDYNTVQQGGTTIILQAATTSSLNSKGIGLFWNPNYNDITVWDDTFSLQLENSYNNEFFDMEELLSCDAPTNVYLKPNIYQNSAIVSLDNNASASFFTDIENYPIAFEGDNTGITGSFTGFNYTSSYSEGELVIWGGRVWENQNGGLGYSDGQFFIEGPEWALVPYSSANYTLVADEIEFDVEHNYISYRRDARNNVEVTSIYLDDEEAQEDDNSTIKHFPWGHNDIKNVSLENTEIYNLVNFHNSNSINGLHMKHNSRFEANYWGKNNDFEEIYGDFDSDISDLSLGSYVNISNIRLGINSTIGGENTVYIVGNDGDTLHSITMGNDCEIGGIEMYEDAEMYGIELTNDADIYNITMYNDSEIYDITMESNSSFNAVSMGSDSSISSIKLEDDAYLSDINIDVDGEITDIKLGISSNINYINIGENSSITSIELGIDSYITCINLYSDPENYVNSYMEYVKLGSNSSIVNVTLHPATYISYINGSGDCGLGDVIVTGSGAYISGFEMEQSTGFGGLTVDSSNYNSHLEDFKIGQNAGFGGITIESEIEDVTIERGFSNFQANELTLGVTGSLSWEDTNSMTQLDASKTFHILDTTGWDGTNDNLNYYLPDGFYNGQTVKLFTTNNGTNMGSLSGIRVWCNLGVPFNDNGGNYDWYPFVTFDNGLNEVVTRKDVPTAIWLGDKWIIDNDYYND